ncbi:MAG: FAD-binding oxidoreductase [Sandaracinus sp.]|nr:FAD-binding oxidoreductase [Sandaracinus sp.]MCB9635369.1 FAD-binding oxidoreductase [Sandaracinus sp.]
MSTQLTDFRCPVVTPLDGRAYRLAQYQYATTSRPAEQMTPGVIVRPQPPHAYEDVARALRYARERGMAVAVRTGGHCYTGTSSTSRENLQLDLRDAFPEWEHDRASGRIRCGISRTLHDFKSRLAAHVDDRGRPDPLFVPAGQCYAVNLGGHCMTGGVGQSTRAFGMLADHLLEADVILASGERRTIGPKSTKLEDRELFWAMFGGGPGDYALLTHVTFRPLRDADHAHARGFRRIFPYDPRFDTDKLEALLQLVVDFADAPQDYDLCVSGGSAELDFVRHRFGFTNRDAYMSSYHAPDKGWFVANKASPVAAVAVFFQYGNVDGRPDGYDPSWANRIRDALARGKRGDLAHRSKVRAAELLSRASVLPEAKNIDDDVTRSISDMAAKLWAFSGVREYSYPFVKNDAISMQETRPGFARWAAERMNTMFEGGADGLMASMQVQQFGGAASAKVKNGARGETSFQWRDGMVVGMNSFYDPSVPGSLAKAEAWHARIDGEGTGDAPGYISPKMRRWFGFPTGPQTMSEVWPAYFDEDAWAKCRRIKQSVDPDGVLSATAFSIGYDLRP